MMHTDARALLTPLLGRTLPTRRGKPNRLLGFRGENVIVGTNQSPAGKPVPLRYVDDALRRLAVEGEVEISVQSLGHRRSSFVGAVLRQLPGVSTQGRTIRLLHTNAPTEWSIPVGAVMKRTELHRRYGGSGRSGISPSRQSPNVLVFSDPTAGAAHGYIYDAWDSVAAGLFHYTGEGKFVDQRMTNGNRAIRDHAESGRALRVFRGVRGDVRYLGEFGLADPAWHYRPAHESGGTAMRQVIVFHLLAVDLAPDARSVDDPREYRRAASDLTTAQEQPWARDPSVVDRSLIAHAVTQNGLNDVIAAAGLSTWSPRTGEPDFDLAWQRGDAIYVAEVKSLPPGGFEDRQMRLGIGQVLDYQALLARAYADVRPVLAVERRPVDPRWTLLCESHGIALVWPETFEVLLDDQLS